MRVQDQKRAMLEPFPEFPAVREFVGKVRADRRCGKAFPLPDGSASECDGASANPCCSRWNFCGPGADHCDCPQCVDFRTSDQKGEFTFDIDRPGGNLQQPPF